MSRAWTKREIERLVWMSLEGETVAAIGARIGRSESGVAQMRVKCGVSSLANCSRGWFGPGHTPANKGLRRPGWSPGRMRETQFKAGQRTGKAAENWRPLGTVLADSKGFLRIKVREGCKGEAYGFGNTKIWPLLGRYTWEKERGPIPPGHKVVFKDGDRANCAPENLELISNAEMMRRNSIHTQYPKDVVKTIMLLGVVKRKLREKRAQEHDDGSAQPSV